CRLSPLLAVSPGSRHPGYAKCASRARLLWSWPSYPQERSGRPCGVFRQSREVGLSIGTVIRQLCSSPEGFNPMNTAQSPAAPWIIPRGTVCVTHPTPHVLKFLARPGRKKFLGSLVCCPTAPTGFSEYTRRTPQARHVTTRSAVAHPGARERLPSDGGRF